MRLQLLAARLAFAGFVLSAVISLTASFGTRLGLWSYKVGQPLVFPATVIGLVAVVAGIVWLLSSLIRNSSMGARWGVIGLLGAILAVWIPLNYARLQLTSPPIHDVSTDIGTAPQFVALLPLRAGAENGSDYDGPKTVKLLSGKVTTVAALQKKYYGDVIPFAQFIKPAKLFWRALAVAKSMGWNIVAFDQKDGRIEATATTFWFGFKDDIVIRVRPAGKLGARLDIRSKSRVGKSDLGSDAGYCRSFLKTLKSMG
jgi:uncharacterized protein (DUF1499 family)